MGYVLLIVAIVFEVSGTTCMKLSEGFTRWLPSVLIFVFYALSFVAFTYVLRYMDVSVAYAIWAGLGVLLISLVGIAYFKEPVTVVRVSCMTLIVIGVVGLNLTGVYR